METITMKAPGISCAHCQAAISGAVGKLPGAENVSVDIADKLVTVTFDPLTLTPERIKAAIEDQGYDVEE
jgi:copper chaperone